MFGSRYLLFVALLTAIDVVAGKSNESTPNPSLFYSSRTDWMILALARGAQACNDALIEIVNQTWYQLLQDLPNHQRAPVFYRPRVQGSIRLARYWVLVWSELWVFLTELQGFWSSGRRRDQCLHAKSQDYNERWNTVRLYRQFDKHLVSVRKIHARLGMSLFASEAVVLPLVSLDGCAKVLIYWQ